MRRWGGLPYSSASGGKERESVPMHGQLLNKTHFLLPSQWPGAPPGSGCAMRLARNNLFVQGLARSNSTGRGNHKREPGEEGIAGIKVIWAAGLLLYLATSLYVSVERKTMATETSFVL